MRGFCFAALTFLPFFALSYPTHPHPLLKHTHTHTHTHTQIGFAKTRGTCFTKDVPVPVKGLPGIIALYCVIAVLLTLAVGFMIRWRVQVARRNRYALELSSPSSGGYDTLMG